MTYVFGALSGLLFGAGAGFIKYLLLWRPLLLGSRICDQKHIMMAQGFSMAANVVVLLAVYFVRNLLPFSFEACIIAAALALSLMGRLSPLGDIRKLEKIMPKQQENEE